MMVWEYFTHFHKHALCYTGVHVYHATSPCIKLFSILNKLLGKNDMVLACSNNKKNADFMTLKVTKGNQAFVGWGD